MKKIFKKILFINILAIFTFVGITNVFAASGYSFSVGTDYGTNNINTNPDTQYVHNKLSSMGYSSYRVTIPTFNAMRSKINTSRYRMESDMLFFAGHANSTTMYWNYLGKGGSYAQAIQNVDYGYCDVPQTYEFHGIGQYNLSYVDFAFFAGCETAKGTSNITKYANTKGAKASLGWKVSVNDYDAYIWT